MNTHIWQHAEDYPDAQDDVDEFCPICGGYLEWVSCYSCFGAGEFDLYDEDPINFSPGEEYERCEVCDGEGGYWVCASLPHAEAKMELAP